MSQKQSKGTVKQNLQKFISLVSYKPPIINTFVLPEIEAPQDAADKSGIKNTQEEEQPGSKGRRRREAPQKNHKIKSPDDNSKSNEESADKVPKESQVKKPTRAKEWHKFHDEDISDAEHISANIDINIDFLKKELNIPVNIDIVIREFKINKETRAFLLFAEGMADRNIINDFILRQLMNPINFEGQNGENLIKFAAENVIAVNQTKFYTKYKDAVTQALLGLTVLFLDGYDTCLAIETRGFEKRSIGKPTAENVVRGSQEGFTEALRTSITQIRRIIKNKELVTEYLSVGESSHTPVAIMYLKNLANPAVIEEVHRRIESIKTDFILGDGMLEQLIEDNPGAIFPQILATERPDRASAHIFEGKVIILAEGTPFCLVVPVTIHGLLQSPEDSSLRWQFGTSLRIIRTIALFVGLLLPGIWIALTNYHQEMLPTDLLISIASSREGVPFPTIMEIIFMELAFELIREAGIRVPGIIGTTLGIIGALILGQAAVAANVVSPITIIIVAVTGLGNFAIPDYALAFGIRLLRFIFILMGSILGFAGISLGLLIVSSLALSMKSFGVPFLSPLWPRTKGRRDLILKSPAWNIEKRPDHLNTLEQTRQPETSRGWTKSYPPRGHRE